MKPIITLENPDINAGVPVRVLGQTVRIKGSRNNQDDPYANGETPVEVQTQTVENLAYVLSPVWVTNAADTLTYAHVLTLYRQRYDGVNKTLLRVRYGNNVQLIGSSITAPTAIPVVLDDFAYTLDTKEVKDAKVPSLVLTFKETA